MKLPAGHDAGISVTALRAETGKSFISNRQRDRLAVGAVLSSCRAGSRRRCGGAAWSAAVCCAGCHAQIRSTGCRRQRCRLRQTRIEDAARWRESRVGYSNYAVYEIRAYNTAAIGCRHCPSVRGRSRSRSYIAV